MDKEFREQIKDILQHEVLLATGCTEPGAVALCVSKACELLDGEPERIVFLLCQPFFISLHFIINVQFDCIYLWIRSSGSR